MKLQTFKFNFKFIRLPKPDVVCNKCSTKTHYPRPITQDPRPKTQDPRPKTQDPRPYILCWVFHFNKLSIE